MKEKERFPFGLIFGISCLFVILPCSGYGASLTIGNTISMTGIDGAEIAAGSPVYVDNIGQLGTVTSSGTIAVNCSANPPESLQSAIDAAQPGDIINVTGTCTAGILIREEKQRIILDGQGAAILQGPNATTNILNIRGKGIVIRNFEMTGGSNGIWVNRGGSAVIANNNIHDTNSDGIVVTQSSSAVIKSNNIHTNGSNGINITEGSSARIGYEFSSDLSASPNTIQSNGGRGIIVTTTSHAGIYGNTIASNTGDGIGVFRGSSANIASNTIEGNLDGISVAHNSAIFLGEDSTATFFGQPNVTNATAANNTKYGIECTFGASVRVPHLGSTNPINGASAQFSLYGNCPSNFPFPL